MGLCTPSHEPTQEPPESEEDDYFQHIQYLAAHTTPYTEDSEEDQLPAIYDTDNDEWTNPFAEGGGIQVIAAGMEYPSLRQLIQELTQGGVPQQVYSTGTVTSHYTPPRDATMGPPGYPPARANSGPSQAPVFEQRTPNTRFQRDRNDELWTLPSAQQKGGAMLVIPT